MARFVVKVVVKAVVKVVVRVMVNVVVKVVDSVRNRQGQGFLGYWVLRLYEQGHV